MKRSKQFYTICATTLMSLTAWGLLGQAQADTVSQTNQPTTAQNSQAAGQTAAVKPASLTAGTQADQTRPTADPTVSQVPSSQAPINQNAAARPGVYNRTQADALDISWMNANMNQGTFGQMKAQGVKHVIIQLTKGTYMHDPYAAEQVRDAYHAGLGVAAYHFTKFNSQNSAIAEANYFADRADQLHLSHSVLMIADVEDRLNMYGGVANDFRAFFNQLNARGYWNHAVYTG